MKKITLIAAAALLLASACTKDKSAGYTVSGNIETAQAGDTVFLCSMQGFFSFVPEDTAIVDDKGHYEFVGSTEGASLRYVLLATQDTTRQAKMGEIVLENAQITLDLPAMKSDKEPEAVSNGPAYKLYQAFMQKEEKFNKATEGDRTVVYEKKGTAEEIAAANKRVEEASRANLQATVRMLIDNAPSTFSDMLLPYFLNEMTPEQKDTLMQKMGTTKEKMPNYEAVLAAEAAEKASAEGATYTDLTMPDLNGKEMKLSQYVGKSKLVLVDFWASWCGPCRAEMPNVVEAYKKYHAKGLEIVGVSFDNDADAWKAGVAQLKMTWPQMSDLKGWESAAAKAYNVTGIPANVLLDQEGKIVAKDLREEALHTTIEKFLK